jgi:hypothetical protein
MLPSQQYFLELQDPGVAVIDESTTVVTALKKGKTRVLLHDHNVDEKDAGIRIPNAMLTVSDPCCVTLAILPHHNWNLMVDEHYEIIVEVYDRYEYLQGSKHSFGSVFCNVFQFQFSFHHSTDALNQVFVTGHWPDYVADYLYQASKHSPDTRDLHPGGLWFDYLAQNQLFWLIFLCHSQWLPVSIIKVMITLMMEAVSYSDMSGSPDCMLQHPRRQPSSYLLL